MNNNQFRAKPGVAYHPPERCVFIQTERGTTRADIGDWIVRDEWGALHKFSGGLFLTMYEPI